MAKTVQPKAVNLQCITIKIPLVQPRWYVWKNSSGGLVVVLCGAAPIDVTASQAESNIAEHVVPGAML